MFNASIEPPEVGSGRSRTPSRAMSWRVFSAVLVAGFFLAGVVGYGLAERRRDSVRPEVVVQAPLPLTTLDRPHGGGAPRATLGTSTSSSTTATATATTASSTSASTSSTTTACASASPGPDWGCVNGAWEFGVPSDAASGSAGGGGASRADGCVTDAPGPLFTCQSGVWIMSGAINTGAASPTGATVTPIKPDTGPTSARTTGNTTVSTCATAAPGPTWTCVNGTWTILGHAVGRDDVRRAGDAWRDVVSRRRAGHRLGVYQRDMAAAPTRGHFCACVRDGNRNPARDTLIGAGLSGDARVSALSGAAWRNCPPCKRRRASASHYHLRSRPRCVLPPLKRERRPGTRTASSGLSAH